MEQAGAFQEVWGMSFTGGIAQSPHVPHRIQFLELVVENQHHGRAWKWEVKEMKVKSFRGISKSMEYYRRLQII